MNNKTIFFMLLLAALSMSFSKKANNAAALPGNGCEPVHNPMAFSNDGYTLVGATIQGNCVDVTVQYSGGCERHDFLMSWNGIVLESFPQQVNFVLQHDSNGDFCEALITETLSFNLHRVKNLRPVVIHINGPNGQVVSVLYQ